MASFQIVRTRRLVMMVALGLILPAFIAPALGLFLGCLWGLVFVAAGWVLVMAGHQAQYPAATRFGISLLAAFACCAILILSVPVGTLNQQLAVVIIIAIEIILLPIAIWAWLVHPVIDRRNSCYHCGYLIINLTESRCPECGTAFDPKRLASPSRSGVGD